MSKKVQAYIISASISTICLAILSILVLQWWYGHPTASIYERCAALAVASLFAILGIRFLFCWISASDLDGETAESENEKSIFLKIVISLLLFRTAIIFLTLILQYISSGYTSLNQLQNIWQSGDGKHYLDIAKRWYISQGDTSEVVRLVFFPLYPILIRIFNFVINNYFASAMMISQLAFAFGGYVLYRLARLDMPHKDAIRSLKYICIFPAAFFFSAPMSESIFLLLTLLSIYFARTDKYFWACVCGGLAAFTRSLGIVLLVPICFELVSKTVKYIKTENKKRGEVWAYVRRYLCLLIIPVGLLLYLLINYTVSGNPFQYAIYQREHWSQELGWFFNTAAYQVKYAIRALDGGSINIFLGLWMPNLLVLFGSLSIMILSVKRIRLSYTAYFIAYYAVSMGTTWLLSAPRYMAAFFPLAFAAAKLTRRKGFDIALTVLYSIGFVLYLYAFVCRWQVF